MLRSHFLFPLGALLLASCEPDEGSSAKADSRQRKSEASLDEILPDTFSHSQISAQDSVGKGPQPRNLAETTDNVCPVHHEKMTLREVPIVFPESTGDGTVPAEAAAAAAFPFGAETIVSEGNALLPSQPLTARVYQCAACIAARRAAEEKRAPAEALHRPSRP